MPELPEVETVRRGLAETLEGARIDRVALGRRDLRFAFPDRFAERLEGRRIEALGRRAKYLVADIEGDEVLAMHLGMSGSFRIESPAKTTVPGAFTHPRSSDRLHDHVRFTLATRNGALTDVVFNDPRRFGYMTLVSRAGFDVHPFFRGLGIEPVGEGLSGSVLVPFFKGRRTPLKAVLLDQRVIAGLGNIYVCEALWRSRLSPRRAAGTLVLKDGTASQRLDRLATNVRETIADAILAGGSSLRDYRQADGSMGYFQHSFAAYGREDEPCRHEGCGGIVKRIVQSGRSTFFCPVCQR